MAGGAPKFPLRLTAPSLSNRSQNRHKSVGLSSLFQEFFQGFNPKLNLLKTELDKSWKDKYMNVSTAISGTAVLPFRQADSSAQTYQVKAEQRDRADRFESSREFGNGAAGAITGATLETFDATIKSPKLAWEVAENLWQAETIGPNLKFLGTLAAVPGAALSIVAAPFYGAFKGANVADDANQATQDVLPKDAAPEFTNRIFNGDSEDSRSLSSRFQESLEELGAKKLEPGAKPFDVPILSPVFSLVGGVVSAGISGVVGLVAGAAAGLLTTGKEIVGGVFGKDQTLGKRVGRIAASPLHTLAIPYGLVKEGLKESVPRGFADGWKHGPFKPVVDTAKASATLAGSVLKEAWER